MSGTSTCRSPVACVRALVLALAFLAIGAQQAKAGLLDDDEARRQIQELTFRTNDRFDTVSKGQVELANQIQALREDNARLRGQVETLTYELESAKKRQQDFYVDLDGRLRKIESPPTASVEARPAEGNKAPVEAAKKAASDPAAETREYEAALNFFRANKLKEAAAAFDAFAKAHPDSTLTASAYYWLGNAHYALRDCKKAIDAHRVVVAKWPANPKAPEALLNVATCQQNLADAKSAKATLERLVAKYSGSAAATTAKQRLKK